METAMQSHSPSSHRTPGSHSNEGMTTKKTALVIVTVIGCLAILWPKVFYPIMFGTSPSKPTFKDQRTGTVGLRQERPAHLHPESIYQAMRERGRAIPIPVSPTPNAERKSSTSNPPPRLVDGRPGPIPGMRPPMGAGSLHQPQQRGTSMGLLMPLYTIGIVVFFGYTLIKIVFKRQVPNAPYGPTPTDPSFRREVFEQDNHSRIEDLNTTLVVTAIQGIIDAADEELNIRDGHNLTRDTNSNKQNDINDHANITNLEKKSSNGYTKIDADPDVAISSNENHNHQLHKRRDASKEREVTVVGMEMTASCEGGQKWTGLSPTSVFHAQTEHPALEEKLPEPHSIYLEGAALAHDSQILVADSQVKREEVYDAELNGNIEVPAVVLSSKMTLSLINLDSNSRDGIENIKQPQSNNLLAEDMEKIGRD